MAQQYNTPDQQSGRANNGTGFLIQLLCVITLFGLIGVAYYIQSFKFYSLASLVVSTGALVWYACWAVLTKPAAQLKEYGGQLDAYGMLYLIIKFICLIVVAILVGTEDNILTNLQNNIVADPLGLSLALVAIFMPLMLGYLMTNYLNGIGLEATKDGVETRLAEAAAEAMQLTDSLKAINTQLDPADIQAALGKTKKALQEVANMADAVQGAGQTVVNLAAITKSVQQVLDGLSARSDQS